MAIENNGQTITVKELKSITKKTHSYLVKTGKNLPIMVWGPMGVGKSAGVKQSAAELGIKCIDVRLTLLNPVDLRGLPTVNREKGIAEWLTAGFLPDVKRDGEEGILFLDEINIAPASVMAAGYQLILDRRIGDYVLPPKWSVMAAGNRTEDSNNITKMPNPLLNRFIHYHIERPEFKEWMSWAVKNGISEKIIGFLNKFPQHLLQAPKNAEKAFPSPRCLRDGSMVLMWNGTEKNIREVKEGDFVVGFSGVDFIKSRVEKTFTTFVKNGLIVSDEESQLECSDEHLFLTEQGYLRGKDIGANIPVYVYRKGYETKRGVDKGIKPNPRMEGVSCGTDRWGGEFLSIAQKGEGGSSRVLRTTAGGTQLFSAIQGFDGVSWIQDKIRGAVKKISQVARQIYGNHFWLWGFLHDRGTVALSNPKETSSYIDEGIYPRTIKAKIRYAVENNIKNEKVCEQYNKDEFSQQSRIVQVGEKTYGETFFDFQTSTSNYVANGFVVHNSWEFASSLVDMGEPVDAAVGGGVAGEFRAYTEVFDRIPDINAILKGEEDIRLPSAKELDVWWATSMALIVAAEPKHWSNVFKYMLQAPIEFTTIVIKSLSDKSDEFFNAIAHSKEFPEFRKKHPALFERDSDD